MRRAEWKPACMASPVCPRVVGPRRTGPAGPWERTDDQDDGGLGALALLPVRLVLYVQVLHPGSRLLALLRARHGCSCLGCFQRSICSELELIVEPISSMSRLQAQSFGMGGGPRWQGFARSSPGRSASLIGLKTPCSDPIPASLAVPLPQPATGGADPLADRVQHPSWLRPALAILPEGCLPASSSASPGPAAAACRRRRRQHLRRLIPWLRTVAMPGAAACHFPLDR